MRKFDRFMEYCEFKGLTDSQLCKDLKVANGTFYSLRKRNADLSPRLVGIICDTYKDINPKWLLNGEGSMINSEAFITNNSAYLITSRLKIIIRELIRKGAIVSQEDLGQKLGYNSEVYFSQLVNGKLSGFPFLEKLKSIFPQVNIDWIKEGKGSCFVNDTEMSTLEFSGSVADLISQQNQKITTLEAENTVLREENKMLKQEIEEYKENDVKNLDNFFELLSMMNEKVDDNSEKIDELSNLIKKQQSA